MQQETNLMQAQIEMLQAQSQLLQAQQNYINTLCGGNIQTVTSLQPIQPIAQPPTTPNIPTFREYAKIFMENSKSTTRISTQAVRRYYLEKHMLKYFGDYHLNEISTSVVQKYVNNELQTQKLKTVKEHISLLKLVINEAVQDDVIPEIKLNLKYPKKEKSEYCVLSNDEFDKLQDELMEMKDCRSIAILIAMNTGLRVGEICGLKWEDIDFEKSMLAVKRTVQRYYDYDLKCTKISIGEPKTAKSKRTVPLSEKLCKHLLEFKQEPNIYIASGNEHPNEPRNMRMSLNRRLKSAKITSHIKFHSLRHTFATRCISRGIDPKTVAELLGHEKCDITLDIYTNCTDEMKSEAIAKLNE